jgi:hypothetical protein
MPGWEACPARFLCKMPATGTGFSHGVLTERLHFALLLKRGLAQSTDKLVEATSWKAYRYRSCELRAQHGAVTGSL